MQVQHFNKNTTYNYNNTKQIIPGLLHEWKMQYENQWNFKNYLQLNNFKGWYYSIIMHHKIIFNK